MTYIVDLEAYEIHPRMKRSFNDFMMNEQVPCIYLILNPKKFSKLES